MSLVRRAAVQRAVVFAFAACVYIQACCGQEHPYRMPEYADSDPPPPRTLEEVTKLLAGVHKTTDGKESAESPLRLVLVAGPKDHGRGEHDYPAWQKVWSRLLAKADKTTVDTAWEFPVGKADRKRQTFLSFSSSEETWDEHRAAAIDPPFCGGGGLVYIHWAIARTGSAGRKWPSGSASPPWADN